MLGAPPSLPQHLLVAIDQEVNRRAEERAEQLCAERVARGVYVVVGDPNEAELDERFGVRPASRTRPMTQRNP